MWSLTERKAAAWTAAREQRRSGLRDSQEIQRSGARAARRLVHEATRNQYDKSISDGRAVAANRAARQVDEEADFETNDATPRRLVERMQSKQSIDDNVERINCD